MNNTGLFVPPGSGNSFIEQPYSIFKPTLTCLVSLYLRISQCICYCCHIGICKECRFLVKGMETASSESVVQTLDDKIRTFRITFYNRFLSRKRMAATVNDSDVEDEEEAATRRVPTKLDYFIP